MAQLNQNYSTNISTVQLSPFGEEQWNRIVTYSPIYLHWTDVIVTSPPVRTQKHPNGKLNAIDPIDLNTLKLEDELLLSEINDMRKMATQSLKGKPPMYPSQTTERRKDVRTISLKLNDLQASSVNFLNESVEHAKHHSSFAESFTEAQSKSKRSALSNQTNQLQVNNDNQPTARRVSQTSFSTRHPSAGAQHRHTPFNREHSFSTINDYRISSPLSISSSKRTNHNTYSNHQMSKSSLSQDMNPISGIVEQPEGEPPSTSQTPSRIKSSTSRSTIQMLKTKHDRQRKKKNIELKTILVEPWKNMPWNDETSEEPIPNSLDIMHKMCGPATPFERNLKYNYGRQLDHYRHSSKKS